MMNKIGDKKKFKGKKSGNLKYLYSEWMGKDLGWCDHYRDVVGERVREEYMYAVANREDFEFHRKINFNLAK